MKAKFQKFKKLAANIASKGLLLFLAAFISASSLFAQAPDLMSYQAVIRDQNNDLAINATVDLYISILEHDPNGAVIFEEFHNPTTNANGLVSLIIGNGQLIAGDLAGIDWEDGPFYIQMFCADYELTGTSQLLSVPYALYAKTSGSSTPGPQGPAGPAGTMAPGSATGDILYWDGSAWAELPIGQQLQVLTVCGGLPVWTTGGVCPPSTVHCSSGPTAVVDVINPVTGKTWMDRNLGATQAASSSTDAASYGDLYQWGRGADGHQCRTSALTQGLSSTDQPGHGDFIQTFGGLNDWRSPQNPNLWQGVNGGVNNPCPSGYRLPTSTELDEERLSWTSNDAAGAFASPLKLPVAGGRGSQGGSIDNIGNRGLLWSSTVSATPGYSDHLYFDYSSPFAFIFESGRGSGFSVRCIKQP